MTASPTYDLTPRQIAVLRYAARGLSSVEIGAELGPSGQTVRHHLQAAREKLNARNTTHAVAIALVEKIITLEE